MSKSLEKYLGLSLPQEWKAFLDHWFQENRKICMLEKLEEAYSKSTIYPEKRKVFKAFQIPENEIKIVILGQDPYHQPHQAHGLSFSVPPGVATPPSLKNIIKEIQSEYNSIAPIPSDLSHWVNQGVFLLNAALTVEAGKAGSHQKLGWHALTDDVIQHISENQRHVVFLLWGAFAQQKVSLINQEHHLVLQSPHPSPLSAYRGFFGNEHFKRANAYLIEHHKKPIAWIP